MSHVRRFIAPQMLYNTLYLAMSSLRNSPSLTCRALSSLLMMVLHISYRLLLSRRCTYLKSELIAGRAISLFGRCWDKCLAHAVRSPFSPRQWLGRPSVSISLYLCTTQGPTYNIFRVLVRNSPMPLVGWFTLRYPTLDCSRRFSGSCHTDYSSQYLLELHT